MSGRDHTQHDDHDHAGHNHDSGHHHAAPPVEFDAAFALGIALNKGLLRRKSSSVLRRTQSRCLLTPRTISATPADFI